MQKLSIATQTPLPAWILGTATRPVKDASVLSIVLYLVLAKLASVLSSD
jgi:hypothetical protein